MANFMIRFTEFQDCDRLKAIMNEYITEFYQRPEPPQKQLDELVQALIKKQIGVQYIAEAEGELIGFVTLYFSYSTLRATRTIILNDLYVIESYRGKGAAQQLFQAALAYTRSEGFSAMSWVTAKDNFRAQRFYQKMGGSVDEWVSYSIV